MAFTPELLCRSKTEFKKNDKISLSNGGVTESFAVTVMLSPSACWIKAKCSLATLLQIFHGTFSMADGHGRAGDSQDEEKTCCPPNHNFQGYETEKYNQRHGCHLVTLEMFC